MIGQKTFQVCCNTRFCSCCWGGELLASSHRPNHVMRLMLKISNSRRVPQQSCPVCDPVHKPRAGIKGSPSWHHERGLFAVWVEIKPLRLHLLSYPYQPWHWNGARVLWAQEVHFLLGSIFQQGFRRLPAQHMLDSHQGISALHLSWKQESDGGLSQLAVLPTQHPSQLKPTLQK